MTAKSLYVPMDPTLSPAELRPWAAGGQPFPLDAPRVSHYYLARNGIWFGIDALGLGPGDEVLMPAYHHGVEVQVLRRKGVRLRYYRINERMEIDWQHLESVVSDRSRLLYLIHYLGFPQSVTRAREFAAAHGIRWFEDCALSLFSGCPEGRLGTFGDASIFCLYKSLPVPHGGMLVLNGSDIPLPKATESPTLASTGTYLVNRWLAHVQARWGAFGRQLGAAVKGVGRSAKRAGGVQSAAIDTNEFEERYVSWGVSRITRLLLRRFDVDRAVERRRHNFRRLVQALHGTGVRLVFDRLPAGVCPLSLAILVPDKPSVHARLLERGVESVQFWSIPNEEIPRGTFPEVDFLRDHVMEVPIHQGLRDRHVDYVASVLADHARWPEVSG